MSEQPTHAMLVRADDGSLHHRPACTSRECAERTITFAEGAQVVGVTHLYPEPIPGVQFWSAVQLGKAPKTAADSSSQWLPIAEAPKDGTSILSYCAESGEVRVVHWGWNQWIADDDSRNYCVETHFISIPPPPATGDQP